MPLIGAAANAGAALDALDGQTARLDQANGRTADVIAIAERCDARSAEVLKALQARRPAWWRIW